MRIVEENNTSLDVEGEIFTHLTSILGDNPSIAVFGKIIGLKYVHGCFRVYEIGDEDGVKFCKERTEIIPLKDFENKIIIIEI